MKKWEDSLDRKVVGFFKEIGTPVLRYSLAVIFIWFGAVKFFGGPADELVANTVYWVDPSWFVPFLGAWEVLIGLCMLYKPLIRFGILIMAPQMLGTFLPLILLPDVVYINFPFILTIEGQYIIKNLVLIAAAIVVGSHVRDG